ncbi:hypothetical protein N781_07560 [Pontibacillus halophilus JSM 076056 = DSM 19796]|uniref:Uncharacterized protein n=1 Tax=Pontibacillus halophilus JSM 076056 = DSM 19796 TaxID=1385510 RepID=A0A0A5GES1_9BACI|nr:hypothetical protein [Pontibacillus halophilus]KGX89610.1 hypothetical protein N781_07560 [Pontibacillus halophilus JSM 076056 = DSM 19796]
MYYVPVCLHVIYPAFVPTRQKKFPDINPDRFIQSADNFSALYKDAEKITSKLSTSRTFSVEVMEHAQQSNHNEVVAMFKQLNLLHPFTLDYNPDNLTVVLTKRTGDYECCKLTLAIRWM